MKAYKHRLSGLTLIELTLVIVITGIISAIVAVFLNPPIQQYLAIARRAELTDIADTALRRIGRDIRTAVPNSIRLQGSTALELLPSKDGGRYRIHSAGGSGSCGSSGDELTFATAADDCFEILGPAINFAANDQIVIGSTDPQGNLPYLTPTDSNSIRRTCKTCTASTVMMNPAPPFPSGAEYPSHRFQVISGNLQAVTYVCENSGLSNGEGTGVLRRYWAYGFNPSQIAPPIGGQSALLASKISNCNFTYSTIHQRNGLVAMSLAITSDNETVNLYQEIHVLNVP